LETLGDRLSLSEYADHLNDQAKEFSLLIEEDADPRDTNPAIAIEWDLWLAESIINNLPDWAKE
jgi:hypothetical protein